MADQNLQAAQAAAVLNQLPPPPSQNPDEPPANPQNAAAEEVTLDLSLIFFCLKSVLLRNTCCLHRRFQFIFISCCDALLRNVKFYSNCFADEVKFPLRLCRSYTPLISFAANVELYSPLSTLPQNVLFFIALEAILDYTTCSFEGNSSLFPAGVMPCFTILFYFSHCSFPF